MQQEFEIKLKIGMLMQYDCEMNQKI